MGSICRSVEDSNSGRNREYMLIAAKHTFFFEKNGSILPKEFMELPFVNTNGTTIAGDTGKVPNLAAAFNTGITPKINTVVDTILCPGDPKTGEWETFMGGSTNGDAVAGSWLLRRLGREKRLVFSVNAWAGGEAYSSNFTNEASWIKIHITVTEIQYDVDGTVTVVSVPNSSSLSGSGTIWIGAAGKSNTDSEIRGCKALIGRTTITENGIFLRDYVPAMRKLDSVCGFYDIVSNEFKTSETNHVFTANGYA